MRSRSLLLLLFLALSLAAPVLRADDPTIEERKQRIRDELQRRRDLREKDAAQMRYLTGGVFYPKVEATFGEATEIPVGYAAQLFATASGKEVMVSRTVAARKLPAVAKGATLADLTAILRAAGVRITEVGRATVVLTDAAD